MLVIKLLIWFLEFLFFAGLIGSALVVILTGFEDLKEITDKPDAREKEPAYSSAVQPLSNHPA
jgi:hypothetical protein